jgi:hypothetical protein
MGKLTLTYLAVVLAVFAAQAALPTETANAVPASWIAKVVSERETVPKLPEVVSPNK